MAFPVFRGDAQAFAKVDQITFTGAFAAAVTVEVEINRKIVAYVTVPADTDLTGAAASVAATLAASTIPEFREITWTSDGPDLFATATTAGIPFEITSISASASITFSAITNVTPSAGPNHWDDPNNWDTGVVPTGSGVDTVTVTGTSAIRYGLNQSGVTALQLLIDENMTADIGLPLLNPLGYYEYRETRLRISATTCIVRSRGGITRIDLGSNQTALTIQSPASPTNGVVAISILGSHASNTLDVLQGVVGIATDPQTTAQFPTVRIGAVQSQRTDARVTFGTGCTLGVATQTGGDVTYRSNLTTLTVNAGTATVERTATVGTLSGQGGTCFYQSTGTITTLTVGTDHTIDFSRDLRPRTVTNSSIQAKGGLLDPSKTVIFTTPLLLDNCSLSEINLDLGSNFSIQRS
jgi:hypothetical protein